MRDIETLLRRGETRKSHRALAGLCLALLCGTAGCNGLPSAKEAATETPANVPQTYMAPSVGNANQVTSALEIYSFDNVQNTFQQATSDLSHGFQSQINTSGNLTPLARNLLELDTTYTFPFAQGGVGSGVTGTAYSPALPGGWAVQLPDKTGGLVQLFQQPVNQPGTALNQPVTPLVAAVCPSSATAQTYQFLTLPNALYLPAAGGPSTGFQQWNPLFETAYGSVAISGSGGSVTLANTQQSTFAGAPPGTAYAAGATGVCSSTLYGNTISVPGALTITSPGSGQQVSASATIGISTSGLLVEDNGANLSAGGYSNGLFYQNALGAGTGAIGMVKPSTALSASALVAAQYSGFIFGSGDQAVSQANFSSTVASFGFSTTPASCASVAASTSTLLYGGDFPNNDPSAAAVQSAGGFSNCDYAIDLGQQDASNNGHYPAATIHVGAAFSGNTTGTAYSFPAIAIAGQLAGKYAIFVLGVDTTGSPNQAVGIYLLQSN